VALEGRIESRRYTASDGTPRKSWECKGERLAVLTWPKDEEGGAVAESDEEPEEPLQESASNNTGDKEGVSLSPARSDRPERVAR
jgi:single-stranded DNA-binding protein